MLKPLGEEGWRGLSPLIQMRLENSITKDVLAGRKDIYQVTSVSGGALGTYAAAFWPFFSNPIAVSDNLISLLRQDWYTQNYVGEFFMYQLPRLAERTGKIDETIEAFKVAIRNDARLIVNNLGKLPGDWVKKIRDE